MTHTTHTAQTTHRNDLAPWHEALVELRGVDLGTKSPSERALYVVFAGEHAQAMVREASVCAASAAHRAEAERLAVEFAELRDAAAYPTRPPTVTHEGLLGLVPAVVR